MVISDFHIGLTFFNCLGDWRCTDVGSRTIAAIRTADQLPAAWYEGPPYAVEERLFNEQDMARSFVTLKDAITDRRDKYSIKHEHVMRMMDASLEMWKLKRPYPKDRHAIFEIDRLSHDGQLLHPFSAKRRKGYWAIQYFVPSAEQYGEMPENDFVGLARA